MKVLNSEVETEKMFAPKNPWMKGLGFIIPGNVGFPKFGYVFSELRESASYSLRVFGGSPVSEKHPYSVRELHRMPMRFQEVLALEANGFGMAGQPPGTPKRLTHRTLNAIQSLYRTPERWEGSR